MKIAAITMVCNEALILPYFLRHYQYLDEIHVLYETDSTDDTLEILKRTQNVIIKYAHIESGFDSIDKVDKINNTLHEIEADWVYIVDSDEFIFPQNESPHDFLKRQNYDVVRAVMFQVYRHRTDKDLDPSLPPIPQRIHGDPDVFSTILSENRDCNSHYIKPIVVRPSKRIRFGPGNHMIEGNITISPEFYMGAHWQMADPAIAIDRRLKNKARMSERNKAQGMGWQHFDVTGEWIKNECKRHLDDPIIEALCPLDKMSPLEIAALIKKLFMSSFEIRNQYKDRENQISELNQHIQRLEIDLQQIRNRNVEITSTITWRIAGKICRILDTIFPPNTGSRLLIKRVFLSLLRCK